MKFGYTIIFTGDVEQSISFFEKAFGFKRRFVHESGYGELETGATALAFAAHDLARSNLPAGYVTGTLAQPLGVEIGLVSEDVQADYQRALRLRGDVDLSPVPKALGADGFLRPMPGWDAREICSAVGS